MAEKPLLKTTVPIIRMGSRTFALYVDSYTDKKGTARQSSVLGEVEAVPDAKDPTRIGGWKPRFQGQRIMGSSEEFTAFLKGLAVHA